MDTIKKCICGDPYCPPSLHFRHRQYFGGEKVTLHDPALVKEARNRLSLEYLQRRFGVTPANALKLQDDMIAMLYPGGNQPATAEHVAATMGAPAQKEHSQSAPLSEGAPAVTTTEPLDHRRFMEVSRFELSAKNSAAFLFNCYQIFKSRHTQPYIGEGGNLILMWREDFKPISPAVPLAPTPDEEMVPHAFNPRSTHIDEIWCNDCAYHRDREDAHPRRPVPLAPTPPRVDQSIQTHAEAINWLHKIARRTTGSEYEALMIAITALRSGGSR